MPIKENKTLQFMRTDIKYYQSL